MSSDKLKREDLSSKALTLNIKYMHGSAHTYPVKNPSKTTPEIT